MDVGPSGVRARGGVGVPLPRLVHFAEHDDHIVRIYEWIDGRSPMDIAGDPDQVERLFGSLGTAIAKLHSIELDGFSSRLDGSAPSYRSWADYVDYRLEQIRGRCMEHGILDAPTMNRASTAISELADEVADSARPTLCHRDLYADNLVVDEDGALVAILDWDMAEAWDPAGEWFKLDWLLFPEFPNAEASFDAAYHAVHPSARAVDAAQAPRRPDGDAECRRQRDCPAVGRRLRRACSERCLDSLLGARPANW